MIPEKLQKAIESLGLADIVLSAIHGDVGGEFALGIDIPKFRLETNKPHPVSVQIFDSETDGGPRRVQVRVKAGARLLPREPKASEEKVPGDTASEDYIAHLVTEFLVTYVEKEGADLDEDSLTQFAEHNVPFNVWPYWREVVHASFSRMGLPKVVLPLYRMRRIEKVSTE